MGNALSRKMIGQSVLFGALALAAVAVVPVGGATQEGPDATCARCEDCESCGRSPWGGNSCKFTSKDGCCEEDDGNCNPSSALNVDDEDRRVVVTVDGSLLVVRLFGDTFGTWSCDGELRAVFRETSSGAFMRASALDFRNYERRYALEAYVKALTEQLLAGAG